MIFTTTLTLLRNEGSRQKRSRRIAKSVGGSRAYGEATPIPIATILEMHGLNDAIAALRAVPDDQEAERDRLARLFACWCVRHTPLADGRVVWNLLADERSRNVVEVAERYACGRASEKELADARTASKTAYLAAWDDANRNIRAAVSTGAYAAAYAAEAADYTAHACASRATNAASYAEAAVSPWTAVARTAQGAQLAKMLREIES